MVTLPGSPPNCLMFCWTHRRAITWSLRPALPGTFSFSKLRKPIVQRPVLQIIDYVKCLDFMRLYNGIKLLLWCKPDCCISTLILCTKILFINYTVSCDNSNKAHFHTFCCSIRYYKKSWLTQLELFQCESHFTFCTMLGKIYFTFIYIFCIALKISVLKT